MVLRELNEWAMNMSQKEELEKVHNSPKDFRIWVVDKINTLTEDVATLKNNDKWIIRLLAVLITLVAILYGIENLPL